MRATTWRWRCTPPFLPLVISFSAYGRSALACDRGGDAAVLEEADGEVRHELTLVVRVPAETGTLLRGRGIRSVLHPQREAALVELLR